MVKAIVGLAFYLPLGFVVADEVIEQSAGFLARNVFVPAILVSGTSLKATLMTRPDFVLGALAFERQEGLVRR